MFCILAKKSYDASVDKITGFLADCAEFHFQRLLYYLLTEASGESAWIWSRRSPSKKCFSKSFIKWPSFSLMVQSVNAYRFLTLIGRTWLAFLQIALKHIGGILGRKSYNLNSFFGKFIEITINDEEKGFTM